eukprot:3928982-Amphidinium_carterae.1
MFVFSMLVNGVTCMKWFGALLGLCDGCGSILSSGADSYSDRHEEGCSLSTYSQVSARACLSMQDMIQRFLSLGHPLSLSLPHPSSKYPSNLNYCHVNGVARATIGNNTQDFMHKSSRNFQRAPNHRVSDIRAKSTLNITLFVGNRGSTPNPKSQWMLGGLFRDLGIGVGVDLGLGMKMLERESPRDFISSLDMQPMKPNLETHMFCKGSLACRR